MGIHKKIPRFLQITAGLCLLVGLTLGAVSTADANPVHAPLPQTPTGNEACLACHGKPDQTTKFDNGDVLNLTIDPQMYRVSSHGTQNLPCAACHPTITGFPHPEKTAKSLREYELQMRDTCKTCHTDQYDQIKNNVHTKALEAGNENAPTCVNCHNPHTQPVLEKDGVKTVEGRVGVAETCAKCHSGIYDQYKNSVHGSALIGEGNPDVPTCSDCHGEHTIVDPTTAQFRNASPELCSKCHTNKAIMNQYGLSTQVLNTYVADFHGTTVTLFEKESPDQVTNKAVCFDCHGVHDIVRTDDPQKGLVLKQNLLATCQKCHPNASTNFPTSWLSHYIPSPQRSPLVFYVNLFYQIFIPLVIGGMAFYVITDIVRRLIEKRRKGAVKS